LCSRKRSIAPYISTGLNKFSLQHVDELLQSHHA